MRSILILGLWVFFACAFDEFVMPSDNDNPSSRPNAVFQLTAENFTQFIKQHPVTLVEFYAPWCHHCKQLEPHYEAAANILRDDDSPVALAKVDATAVESLAQEYSIEGYPTLKIFHQKSEKPIDYDGPRRSGSDIAEYMRAFADPNWTPPPSDVVILNTENFTTFIFNEELSLVEFYAPSCSYCKQLEPKFEKAATMLKKDTNIRLAKVDGVAETSLAVNHNITGYPSLFVYRKGGRRSQFDGEHTEEGIVSTMKELLSLPSREIRNTNDYKNLFHEYDQAVIIGIFPNENDRLYQLFLDFAYGNRKNFQFGHTFQSIGPLSDVKGPAIVFQHHPEVRSKFEKDKYVFNQENAFLKDIEAFVEKHRVPLVGLLTKKSQRTTYVNRRPICVIIYDLDFSFDYRERTQYWRNKVVKIAQNYKDKYTFAVADEAEMASLLKEFGLEESGEDVNVCCFDMNGAKYRMEDNDEFTSEALEEFIDRMDKGKLKPYLKSQPIPKQSTINGIRTVVGKNFNDIVNDKTKDVMMFFYAPWCGHCTNFKPTYSELAQRYTSQSNLVFAQMDATSNDVPQEFHVTGFPTIYIIPKNNRAVKYEGNREIDDLVKFIEKNTQTKNEL